MFGLAMTYNIGTVCYGLDSPGDGSHWIVDRWSIVEPLKKGQRPAYRPPRLIAGIMHTEIATLFHEFACLYPESPYAKWVRQLSDSVESQAA
jgi:hypothetical protein